MLSGTEMLDGEGKKVIGTMPDNGAISSTMDGLETQSVSIPVGYTSGGTVSLDSTIDNTANSQATQIDEIMELLEGKSAGDGGSGGAAETCTLQIYDRLKIYAIAYTTVDSGGNVAHAYVIPNSTSQTITCLCNSTVAISHYYAVVSSPIAGITCDGCEMLYCAGDTDALGHSFIGLTCGAGETATFVAATSGGGGAA